jgi:peptidoglycan hydrolase CwlO-like protein
VSQQTKSGEKKSLGELIKHDLIEISPFKYDNETTTYTHELKNISATLTFCFETTVKTRKGASVTALASSLRLSPDDIASRHSGMTERDISENELSDVEDRGNRELDQVGSPRAEEFQFQLDSYSSQLTELNNKNNNLQKQLQESAKQVSELNTQNSDLQNQIRTLNQKIIDLEKKQIPISPRSSVSTPTTPTSPRINESDVKKKLYTIIGQTQQNLNELTVAYKQDIEKLQDTIIQLNKEKNDLHLGLNQNGPRKIHFTLDHYEQLNAVIEAMEVDFCRMRKLVVNNEDVSII